MVVYSVYIMNYLEVAAKTMDLFTPICLYYGVTSLKTSYVTRAHVNSICTNYATCAPYMETY